METEIRGFAPRSRSMRDEVGGCGGAGSRTHLKGPNRNERRRGLTHQIHEIVWTSRSRSIPRRPVPSRP